MSNARRIKSLSLIRPNQKNLQHRITGVMEVVEDNISKHGWRRLSPSLPAALVTDEVDIRGKLSVELQQFAFEVCSM